MSDDYIIHYHCSCGGKGEYGGSDMFDDADEYHQTIEHKVKEGWRVFESVASIPNFTIMTMEVRR